MSLETDVVCAVCSCLCDDLTVEVQNNQILPVEHACPLACSVFTQLNAARPDVAQHRGTACSLEEGLGAAAEVLSRSRAPLICGLTGGTTDDYRAAIELAEHLGGIIDTGGPLTRASLLAMQQVGLSTCTLGEVKQRSDLVIYWGADPVRTHPRHLERYTAEPVSEFLPGGRSDRTLMTIGSQANQTDARADVVLRIRSGDDLELISALRQCLRRPGEASVAAAGLASESIAELAQGMTSCRYGVIFYGTGLLAEPVPSLTVEALTRLVLELNAHTRFSMRALGQPGAENVLAWQTGFPCAVDFQQLFPRYSPGEFSAAELLERGEVDCCLIVGSSALEHLSAGARARLQKLPLIVIDPPHLRLPWTPQVQFTSAFPGVQTGGTMSRMDDVALQLKKLYESEYPSAGAILDRLLVKLRERAGVKKSPHSA